MNAGQRMSIRGMASCRTCSFWEHAYMIRKDRGERSCKRVSPLTMCLDIINGPSVYRHVIITSSDQPDRYRRGWHFGFGTPRSATTALPLPWAMPILRIRSLRCSDTYVSYFLDFRFTGWAYHPTVKAPPAEKRVVQRSSVLGMRDRCLA